MSPTIFFFLFNFHGLRLFNYLLEVEHIFTPSSINAKLHIIGSEIPPIVKTGLEPINNSHYGIGQDPMGPWSCLFLTFFEL